MNYQRLFILISFIASSWSGLFAQYRLSFDGYGDYVQFNTADIAPPYTFETWVRRSGVTPYSHLMTGTDGISGFRLEQYINTSNIGITDKGVADYSYNYQTPVGGWVHLAFVCNGTSTQLFENGIAKGVVNAHVNVPMGSIGAQIFGAGALYAQIDEMRIWSKALTAAEITQYMNRNIDNSNPNYSTLLHYYKFDEGAGDTIHDLKGNVNGIRHGATWVPVSAKDVEISALLTPAEIVSDFGVSQQVKVRIANVGTDTIDSDFTLSYILDGGTPVNLTVAAGTNHLLPNAIRDLSFPNIDLSQADIHLFKIYHSYASDAFHSNDTLTVTSGKSVITLHTITKFEPGDGEFTFFDNITRVKVSYYRDDIFRIQLGPTGDFISNTEGLLTMPAGLYKNVTWNDESDYYKLETNTNILRVYKSPFRFALYKKDNNTLVWEEDASLVFGEKTIQQIKVDNKENFYGCGMQNGYFSHKNRSVKIENDYSNNWGVGSVPNPAPFFMSTAGYGMFRNTFSPGQYDFYSTVNLQHEDRNFDSYYFTGNTLKDILEGYTYITGRPFMIPRWGLEYGDADCYNKTGTTMDVVNKIARVYRAKDMPAGWILPNDGYGCGYRDLDLVNDSLQKLGFHAGLWSENPVSNSGFEVGQAGVGVYKLDVALVGPGYKSAFNSGLSAFGGIENNANRRGFVWTVAGWAGTHRFATIWSGDQSGSWDNIKIHIPTVIGAGLSGFNCATGDVDGIFGGSASMYVRDLQWKCFTPTLMSISGWADRGKQPYAYGGATEKYNQSALKLKMRLTPYFYSYCRQANLTGVPTARAMVLEFPGDTTTYSTTTQYQFMSGEWFLVAPVYTNTTIKNDIYLPATRWVDYWDGTLYEGPLKLNNYATPLNKLPLFVKAGAIIPMYPEMLYDNQKPKDTLSLDLYPYGKSSFSLYEDDGITKDYRTGAFATTEIKLDGPVSGFDQPVIATISPSIGTYDGMLSSRNNNLDFHFSYKPGYVILDNKDTLPEYASLTDLNLAARGWYFDPADKKGITHVKAGKIGLSTGFEVKLTDFTLIATQSPEEESYMKVYPSPTSGTINITPTSGTSIQSVTVFDTNGKTVHSAVVKERDSVTVKLPDVPGVYLLHIRTNRGVTVKRVVLAK